MLNIVITLFLVIGGIHASPSILDHPCEELRCKKPAEPKGFPENNEELQLICNSVIEWIECEINYAECWNDDAEGVQLGYRLLGVVKDVCSEDTLLHSAVVDNLKCVKKLLPDERRYCHSQEESSHRVQQFVEALSEEGLVSLTENENETRRIYRCIEIVDFVACRALQLEEECGTIAMDAYVEISQRIGAGVLMVGCDEAFDFLPTIIRLRKLEEEKKRDVAEAFRKKK